MSELTDFMCHVSCQIYHIYPKYSDRHSEQLDSNQMLHSAASDLSLHCLLLIKQF